MTHDDEFNEQWRDAVRSYNSPPEPPREAMWESISRARAADSVVPLASLRRTPRWLAAVAGIAAVLMIGIAIGRASRETGAPPVVAIMNADQPVAADLPVIAPAESAVEVESSFSPPAVDAPPAPSRGTRQLAQGRRADRRAPGRERANVAGDAVSETNAYRFAVVEHLTRTEVLLTSFRAQARSADEIALDAQFATLTRDLLATTRLLLATRRADDPMTTRLLEDLELVLMQLSQYARDGRRIDLDATTQSLDKRNVLPKLRSSIPAGVSASAGT